MSDYSDGVSDEDVQAILDAEPDPTGPPGFLPEYEATENPLGVDPAVMDEYQTMMEKFTADEDGDGIPDFLEPLMNDSDGDGTPDFLEGWGLGGDTTPGETQWPTGPDPVWTADGTEVQPVGYDDNGNPLYGGVIDESEYPTGYLSE